MSYLLVFMGIKGSKKQCYKKIQTSFSEVWIEIRLPWTK